MDESRVSNSAIERLWSLNFLNFCTFWRLKVYKLTKSRASKIAKTAVLEPLDFRQLISSKIWVAENSENSTLCVYSEQTFTLWESEIFWQITHFIFVDPVAYMYHSLIYKYSHCMVWNIWRCTYFHFRSND